MNIPRSRSGGRLATLALATGVLWATSSPALAQGQDSTPGERWLRVMAELLSGAWDNANQAYFDRRRKLPETDRHERVHLEIMPVEAPAFGPVAFLWRETRGAVDEERVSWRIVTLSADGSPEVVVMRHWFGSGDPPAETLRLDPGKLRRREGCDYHFRRRAGGFRGEQEAGACRFDWRGRAVITANRIELAPGELFMHDHKFDAATGERLTGVGSGEPDWLERAREFHCYADIPGVGGGRDEPFERYAGIALHDKGGRHWFRTREENPRELGISLLAVTWPILNEDSGNFNRNSLVIYVSERLSDGATVEHGYAFTEPSAERIGVNLKWMLVNCSLVPPSQARPSL